MKKVDSVIELASYPELVRRFFATTKVVKFKAANGQIISFAPVWDWMSENRLTRDYLNDLYLAFEESSSQPLSGEYQKDAKLRGLRTVLNKWDARFRREIGGTVVSGKAKSGNGEKDPWSNVEDTGGEPGLVVSDVDDVLERRQLWHYATAPEEASTFRARLVRGTQIAEAKLPLDPVLARRSWWHQKISEVAGSA